MFANASDSYHNLLAIASTTGYNINTEHKNYDTAKDKHWPQYLQLFSGTNGRQVAYLLCIVHN